jgi:hypothetical protein
LYFGQNQTNSTFSSVADCDEEASRRNNFSFSPPLTMLYDATVTIRLTSCDSQNGNSYTLAGCQSVYGLAGYPWAYSQTLFSLEALLGVNGNYWQRLALPCAGWYSVVAAGAVGVGGLRTDRCRGAVISDIFYFPYGTELYALVGAMGSTDTSSGGGGGGSFVALANGTVLVVAGGGGGNWGAGFGHDWDIIYSGCDASLLSTSGNPGSTGIDGGNNGQSAILTGQAGQGGKGLVDIFEDPTGFIDGILYSGGFGGGANLGGGGGYSGGGGLPYATGETYAGGGGSFCRSGLSNCQNNISYNTGDGYVTISFLWAVGGPSPPNPPNMVPTNFNSTPSPSPLPVNGGQL